MKRIVGIILIVIGIIFLFNVIGLGGNGLFNGRFSFNIEMLNQEQTIDLSDVQSISLESGSTNIEMIKGSSQQAVIRLHGRASSSLVQSIKLNVKKNNGTLNIGVDRPNITVNPVILGWNSFKLTVEVPAKQWESVTLNTGSGNIKLKDIVANQVEVAAGSGNLVVEKIQSTELTTKVNRGNIKLNQIAATHLSFQTGSGNVILIEGHGQITGRTGSGNITIETDQLLHDVDLRTGSGNVKITLENSPTDLAVNYKAGSGRGTISHDGFVARVTTNNRDEIRGAYGNGTIKLTVQTGSGNFTFN